MDDLKMGLGSNGEVCQRERGHRCPRCGLPVARRNLNVVASSQIAIDGALDRPVARHVEVAVAGVAEGGVDARRQERRDENEGEHAKRAAVEAGSSHG